MTEKAPFLPGYDIDLRSLLDTYAFDTIRTINCILAGKITAYNGTKNTASVAIQATRPYADGSIVAYPPLADCPVIVLQGGNSHLEMPITVGDFCLVLCNDRDIDSWFTTGQVTVPNTNRAHSLSDGFVLVGVRPLSSPLTLIGNPGIFSTDKAVSLKGVGATVDGTTGAATVQGTGATINAESGTVVIKNTLQSLKTLIDTLCTTITNLKVLDTGTPTVPAGTWPIDPATSTAISTLKSTFDELLGA